MIGIVELRRPWQKFVSRSRLLSSVHNQEAPLMEKLRLVHYDIESWIEERLAQARGLGCSEEYIKRLAADLRLRYAVEAKEVKLR
jgi:hypothetical protein